MKQDVSNAINLLYKQTSALKLTREEHGEIDKAFRTLVSELTPKPVVSKKKKNENNG